MKKFNKEKFLSETREDIVGIKSTLTPEAATRLFAPIEGAIEELKNLPDWGVPEAKVILEMMSRIVSYLKENLLTPLENGLANTKK